MINAIIVTNSQVTMLALLFRFLYPGGIPKMLWPCLQPGDWNLAPMIGQNVREILP